MNDNTTVSIYLTFLISHACRQINWVLSQVWKYKTPHQQRSTQPCRQYRFPYPIWLNWNYVHNITDLYHKSWTAPKCTAYVIFVNFYCLYKLSYCYWLSRKKNISYIFPHDCYSGIALPEGYLCTDTCWLK